MHHQQQHTRTTIHVFLLDMQSKFSFLPCYRYHGQHLNITGKQARQCHEERWPAGAIFYNLDGSHRTGDDDGPPLRRQFCSHFQSTYYVLSTRRRSPFRPRRERNERSNSFIDCVNKVLVANIGS